MVSVARTSAITPASVPADTTLSGEEFFRTEGVHTSLGAAIPGGRIGRWILREGPRIDSAIELFDELCWRVVGDGVPLWRATLHVGTLHPQIRGLGARWLREAKLVEEYRILRGADDTEEYLRSPIRATIELGTPFRRRLIEDRRSIRCCPGSEGPALPIILRWRSIVPSGASRS